MKRRIILLCFIVVLSGCATATRSTIPPYNPPISDENISELIIPNYITLQSMDGKDFWEDGSLVSNTEIEIPSGTHSFLCSFKKKINNKTYSKKDINITFNIEPNSEYKIVYYLRPLAKDSFDIEVLIEKEE